MSKGNSHLIVDLHWIDRKMFGMALKTWWMATTRFVMRVGLKSEDDD